jgi:tetratricopeptide (TPR) repeat protein
MNPIEKSKRDNGLVDLSILEDRENLFSFLRDCELCLLSNNENNHSFKILFQVWNKVGIQLYELGYWDNFKRCGNIALRMAKRQNDISAQAQILLEVGWVGMEEEYFDEAQKHFKKALQKFQLLEDVIGECRALRYLGVLFQRKFHLDSAQFYYRKALKIATEQRLKALSCNQIEWLASEAEIHNILGSFYLKYWNFPASYRELYLSLEQYSYCSKKDSQYYYYQPAPLRNLGQWYFQQGNYKKAKQYYQDCYQLSQELKRTDMAAGVLIKLAEVAKAENNKEEFLRLTEKAKHIAGNELNVVRNRAAHLKEQVLGKKNIFLRLSHYQVLTYCLIVFNLLRTSPLTALSILKQYLAFTFKSIWQRWKHFCTNL